jgi:hypothetical protein
LEEIVVAPVKKTETNDQGIHCDNHTTTSIRKSWHYFANKWRSLSLHCSLPDQSQEVFFKLTFINSQQHTHDNMLVTNYTSKMMSSIAAMFLGTSAKYNNNTLIRPRGFHGSNNEQYYLLGCDTMQSGRSLPTFRGNTLPPSSELKSKPSRTLCSLGPITSAKLHGHHIAEDSVLHL